MEYNLEFIIILENILFDVNSIFTLYEFLTQRKCILLLSVSS